MSTPCGISSENTTYAAHRATTHRPLAMAADRRFAVVDGVRVIDESTLDLGVPVLPARFVA